MMIYDDIKILITDILILNKHTWELYAVSKEGCYRIPYGIRVRVHLRKNTGRLNVIWRFHIFRLQNTNVCCAYGYPDFEILKGTAGQCFEIVYVYVHQKQLLLWENSIHNTRVVYGVRPFLTSDENENKISNFLIIFRDFICLAFPQMKMKTNPYGRNNKIFYFILLFF